MENKPTLDYGQCYHVYNRGINSMQIFREENDFLAFIDLMRAYLLPIADVFCYALMSNHVHIGLRIKAREEIGWLNPMHANNEDPFIKWSTSFELSISPKQPGPNEMVRHLFNAYSKRLNRRYHRTGKLLEERFERKLIDTEDQLRQVILYVNNNPEKHGVVSHAVDYQWISLHELLSEEENGWLSKDQVISLFNGRELFIAALKRQDFDDWIRELEGKKKE